MTCIGNSDRNQLIALLMQAQGYVPTDHPPRDALVEEAISASSEMLGRVARRCARYGDLPATVHEEDVVAIARSVERTMLDELIDGPPEEDGQLANWESSLRTRTQLVLNAQFPRSTKARNQRALVQHRHAILEASVDPSAPHPSTARQR